MPIGRTDPSLVAHQPLGYCVNLFLGQIRLKVPVVIDFTGWKMASSAMPADPLMVSGCQTTPADTLTRAQETSSSRFLLEIFGRGTSNGLHQYGSHGR